MEALNAVADWLSDHWIKLVSIVAVVAVVAVIALLPLPYRKATLVVLAVIFIAAAAFVVWFAQPWNSTHYSLMGFYFVAAVPAVLGCLCAAWAWIIW